MGKQVTLKFHGDLDRGFQIFWDIRTASNQLIADGDGSLPPAPNLAQQCNQWRNTYGELLGQARAIRPTGIVANGTLSNKRERCADQATKLAQDFNRWLEEATFSIIEKKMMVHIQKIDHLHILIRTDDTRLHYFPWHEWDFLNQYPQAEVGMAEKSFSLKIIPDLKQAVQQINVSSPINVLAIFGDGEGIDLSKDEVLLNKLPNATITALKNCTRKELIEALDKPITWTILFFAGHGETVQKHDGDNTFFPETGWIYLNEKERISLKDLQYSLRGAIKRGLQVAIFNSCQGMGLAYGLAPLNIPSMVVMREEIPDTVAQDFLEFFLKAFSEESPLFLAVRRARGQVKQLIDHQFPGVSGLPIIWQSPATKPMEWPSPPRTVQWWWLLLASVGITASVLALRYLGLLQPWELKAYDHLMRLRPGQDIPDERILVVAIGEEDIQYQRDQGMEMEGSLSDEALLLLLKKISPHQPSVIGLDIIHDFPFATELKEPLQKQNLIAICRDRSAASELVGIAPPNDFPEDKLGFNNVPLDADGVVRRQFLGNLAGSICPTSQSFNFRLAQEYLSRQSGIEMETVPSSSNALPDIKLGKQVFKRFQRMDGGYQLPQREADGYQLLVNYRAENPEHISLRNIISGSLNSQLEDLVHKRIILIGVVNRKNDTQLTPYSQHSKLKEVAGVFVQAQMLSQIISAALGERSLISSWPEWVEAIWILSWTVVGTTIVIVMRSPYKKIIGVITGFTVIWAGSLFFLIQGLWIPLIPSALGWAGSLISSQILIVLFNL